MPILKRVTITGADDGTPVKTLIQCSQRFPFVEWGILASKNNHSGCPRFPSSGWLDELFAEVDRHESNKKRCNFSLHLCGSFVRDLLHGFLDETQFKHFNRFRRIQINTHGEPQIAITNFFERLSFLDPSQEIIFQIDGVNDHLYWAALACGLNCSPLFDKSHGAGVLPSEEWPSLPVPESLKNRAPQNIVKTWAGYAGGLGPENIRRELNSIFDIARFDYWVDMETNVRTNDGKSLDIGRVLDVLECCAYDVGVST